MQNTGVFKEFAQTQEVQSKYVGGSQSTHNSKKNLATRFTYEISTTVTYKTAPDISLSLGATISHKLHMAVTNHSPLVEGARGISGWKGDSYGTVVNAHKDGDSTFQQLLTGVTEGRSTMAQDYIVSAMKPPRNHIGEEGEEWYSRSVQYNDNVPLLDKQHFKGQEVALSRRPDEAVEPVERQSSLHNHSYTAHPHEALDYAPYPLPRLGLPRIYLRDRTAVESSTILKFQEASQSLRI